MAHTINACDHNTFTEMQLQLSIMALIHLCCKGVIISVHPTPRPDSIIPLQHGPYMPGTDGWLSTYRYPQRVMGTLPRSAPEPHAAGQVTSTRITIRKLYTATVSATAHTSVMIT
jgi:hypothetical protein